MQPIQLYDEQLEFIPFGFILPSLKIENLNHEYKSRIRLELTYKCSLTHLLVYPQATFNERNNEEKKTHTYMHTCPDFMHTYRECIHKFIWTYGEAIK